MSNRAIILYGSGSSWRVAIEGKRSYPCDVLKHPTATVASSCEEVSISEVSSEGDILKLLDGRVYEVDSYDTFDTILWLAPADALILDGTSIVNLDDPADPIEVVRLK